MDNWRLIKASNGQKIKLIQNVPGEADTHGAIQRLRASLKS